ncbi:MAG TPA: GNAT family N-acetyltransferase [Burkholderiaceae bacterium]|jgi:RimJ/RimL family protein N-acetyltransferase|nr:GNAT family N-acetyltransferase [Burkholderiaceae bacterium]
MRPLPVLRTQRLLLRWFTPEDAEFVRRLLNDPAWLRHIGDRGVRTRKQATAWIRARLVEPYGRLGFGFWAMERLVDGHLIGLCGLVQRDTLPHADVGYALMPAWRGQGYAREAAVACMRYGREVLGLPAIWGITSPSNADSARVLEDLGLRRDGVRHLAGDATPTQVFRSPDFPLGDDRMQLDALTHRFLAAFTNREGAIPTVTALPHYFTADAVVRVAGPLGETTATGVHGFIAPRAELLFGGRLVDFEEHETGHTMDVAGAIAQRWLHYEKSGRQDGLAFRGAGTKALQFVRTRQGWKIAALAWQDEIIPA